jgi:hypothetical protein
MARGASIRPEKQEHVVHDAAGVEHGGHGVGAHQGVGPEGMTTKEAGCSAGLAGPGQDGGKGIGRDQADDRHQARQPQGREQDVEVGRVHEPGVIVQGKSGLDEILRRRGAETGQKDQNVGHESENRHPGDGADNDGKLEEAVIFHTAAPLPSLRPSSRPPGPARK